MRTPGPRARSATPALVGRLAAVALLAAALSACDSSGPVEDVFLFEGQLEYQGSESHVFTTVDEGIARLEVVALRPRLIDVTFGSNLVVGLGLGRPGAEECRTSFRTNARVGSSFSIGLEEDTEYCLLVFDGGTLPEDALIDYTVSLSAG